MFGASTFASNTSAAPAFGQGQQTATGQFGQAPAGFGSAPAFGQPQQQTSLFGQTQQPQQTSSLFGQPQQPQQPQQQTSLFGQTQQQPQQSSSLFGQSQQPQQSSSLFGQTQQPQQSSSLFGQTQQPQQSSSLFGQSQQPQQTSSLFGQPQQPQQTSSLFGQSHQPQQTSSLFGQAQQPQQTSSLFGQAQQPQQTSLFGQAQQPQQTSLFGQAQQPQQTSLFGQTTQSQPTSGLFGQQQQQTSSLFGQQQQPSTSLFGQTQSQQPSSLFGQSQPQTTSLLGSQQPQSQPTSSLFGQPQTSSLFGSSQQPQQTSSFFGQPQQQQQSSLGSWSAGALVPAQQQQQQQALQPSLPAWEIDVQAIVNAYDPNHPQCRFQYALYNKVDDANGIEPAPAFRIHTGLYQQAVRENPDSKHLVPVPALGFEALKQRIAQQAKARAHHSIEIEICKERINQLEQDHDCIKKVSMPEYRQRHLDLSRRLLAIAKTLDIQQGRGFPRSDAELKLTKELEALERAADKLRVSAEGIASSVPVQGSHESQIDMFRLNPSDPNFKRIYEFLDQQRESLKGLIALLNTDSRDLTIMLKGYSHKLQVSQPSP